MTKTKIVLCLSMLMSLPLFAGGTDPDLVVISGIREQAFEHSQIKEVAAHLTDVIGSRLTGTPELKEANEYTRAKLEEWGLSNAVVEPWGEFGRGWSFSNASVRMTAPRPMHFVGLPGAWTPGTNGPQKGEAIRLSIDSRADMEEWKGKLKGKILLVDDPRDIPQPEEALFRRHDHDSLHNICGYPVRAPGESRGDWRARWRKRYEIANDLRKFLRDEGVVATIGTGSFYGGIVRVTGEGSRHMGDEDTVPNLVLAPEHYTYIARMLSKDHSIELEVNVEAQFHTDDLMAYNTYAEIPGTDKADELVMLGAHLDSWHAGTGATDNAAGVVVMMEAMRILKALDLKPRRTIRVALWTGEEQGLLGSRAFVEQNLAAYPEPTDPEQKKLPRWLQEQTGEMIKKPGFDKFSAYFNLDNGTGKIRGIYAQGNLAAGAIFKKWLEPFHDLEATAVTNRDTGGTDHLAYDTVGLPGFQFIQEPAAYFTRTHHSNMDVSDNLVIPDLMQASAIMASFVYHTAMMDELMPRKPFIKD